MRAWPLFLLLLAVPLAGSALAADRQPPALDLKQLPRPAYKDLPGVRTPEELEAMRNDGFTCTTVLRTYRSNSREGFSRTLPERVYRCEKDGLIVESPAPPARGQWMPGVNPPDARPWR